MLLVANDNMSLAVLISLFFEKLKLPICLDESSGRFSVGIFFVEARALAEVLSSIPRLKLSGTDRLRASKRC